MRLLTLEVGDKVQVKFPDRPDEFNGKFDSMTDNGEYVVNMGGELRIIGQFLWIRLLTEVTHEQS